MSEANNVHELMGNVPCPVCNAHLVVNLRIGMYFFVRSGHSDSRAKPLVPGAFDKNPRKAVLVVHKELHVEVGIGAVFKARKFGEFSAKEPAFEVDRVQHSFSDLDRFILICTQFMVRK